ncbi:hypothetical protein [Rhodoplanes elegans]|uniref:hypothetical protein n=1 Tax=Rhodoplanes elegans TaxID=29408 RepID=UPI001474AA6D|nr:hypothetical protein [Rhodoplanes elegans]
MAVGTPALQFAVSLQLAVVLDAPVQSALCARTADGSTRSAVPASNAAARHAARPRDPGRLRSRIQIMLTGPPGDTFG